MDNSLAARARRGRASAAASSQAGEAKKSFELYSEYSATENYDGFFFKSVEE